MRPGQPAPPWRERGGGLTVGGLAQQPRHNVLGRGELAFADEEWPVGPLEQVEEEDAEGVDVEPERGDALVVVEEDVGGPPQRTVDLDGVFGQALACADLLALAKVGDA